jgi:hypothetical protein
MMHRPAHEVLGLRFGQAPAIAQAALFFAAAALWLLGRRYAGIVQDASIYMLQGLRKLHPGDFDSDLFFVHGSQDAYTAFPQLYATLIDMSGIGPAAMLLTIAGQAAFAGASLALIFRIAKGPARWWCFALLAMISGYYGGVGTMRFAEPFATARSLAEPLVVAALACTLGERHRTAFALLAASAALHPLVAAPGVAAILAWHALTHHRWVWSAPLVAGSAVVLGLAWKKLSIPLDPPWLAAVLDRSPQLFVSQWLAPDWARVLWGVCCVWLGSRFVDLPVRRLALAIAALGAAGIAASWIAVDLFNSALATALQAWRAHWLLQFLAIVLVPVAAAGLWKSGNAARTGAACLVASCCFGRAELPAAAALAAIAMILYASELRSPRWMGEGWHRLALIGVAGAASAGLLFEIQSRLPQAYVSVRSSGWLDYLDTAASVGGLLPVAALIWLAAYSRFATVSLALAAATFAAGIVAWDARKPWPRFVEQAAAGGNPFRTALPPRATVYWPGPYGKTWIALGKPSWISVDQGAGVVFNRETALAYVDRARGAEGLQSAIDNCAMAKPPGCRIAAEPARALCERRDGPDYLVLNARIDGYAADEWAMPPAFGPGRQVLYLYPCRPFLLPSRGK